MAVPTFVGKNLATGGINALPVANNPTGIATADIMFLVTQAVGAETISLSTPASYTEAPSSPQATGTALLGTRGAVWLKRAESATPALPTIADPGDHVLAQLMAFRDGGSTSDAININASAGGIKASASTTITFPSVTTTVADCLIIMIGFRDLDSGAAWVSGTTNSNLTSITEQTDGGGTNGVGGGYCVITGIMATPGVVGTTTATVTSSINTMITLALAPPATTPTNLFFAAA